MPSSREKAYVSSKSCHEDGFFHAFMEKGIRLERFLPATQASHTPSSTLRLSFQNQCTPHKAAMDIGPIKRQSVRRAQRFRTNARKGVNKARACASKSASGKLASADAARARARRTPCVKRARSGSCAVSFPRSAITFRESCAVRQNGTTKKKKGPH